MNATRFSLNSLPRQISSALLIRLIVAVLFAQALFPIQVHTTMVSDADGRLIILCTLSDSPVLPTQTDQNHYTDQSLSAAMLFSQLMAEAVLSFPDITPGSTTAADGRPHTTHTRPASRRLPGQHAIRAPPVTVGFRVTAST